MRQGPPSVDRQAMTLYFAQQRDVVAAYLFGSVARGQAGHLSDVDIFDVKSLLDFHSQALLKQIREVGLSGRKKRHSIARRLRAAYFADLRQRGLHGRQRKD